MNILELSEQEIVRRGSLDEMRRMGIDPYPAALYPTDAYTTEIKETFSDDAPSTRGVHSRPHNEPPHNGQSLIHGTSGLRKAAFKST